MSLRFTDSFDHYAVGNINSKWTTTANIAGFGATYARLGAGGIWLGVSSTLSKTLTNHATWVVGFAANFTALGRNNPFWQLLDAGTQQVGLRESVTGELVFLRGLSTVLATSAANIIQPNVWYYIEIKSTIDGAAGTYEVRVNGTTVLSGTGANTRSTANNYANQVAVAGSGGNIYVDDLYVLDGAGSAPHNDFYGDVRIEARLPNGNGNYSQWAGSDGNSTDNYLLVDDTTPDGDTTYVASSTVNQIDTYPFQDLTPTTGTVYGVVRWPYARKDDAGVRSIADMVRIGGTDYEGSTQALSTSYQYLPEIYEESPATAAAWTIAEVNGAEFGTKLKA